MIENIHSICTSKQLRMITSIVQIGDSVYNEQVKIHMFLTINICLERKNVCILN